MKKNEKKLGFSLIELSVVVLIIGLIIAAVIGGRKLVALSNLSKARALTNSSPVAGIEDLAVWLETTSKNSFLTTPNDGDDITTWRDINPQLTIKNDATQGTTSKQPNYTANGINGLPAITFNGIENSGDALLGGPTNLSSAYTFFAVFKYPTNGEGEIFSIFDLNSTARIQTFVQADGSLIVRAETSYQNHIGRTSDAGVAPIDTPTIVSATYNGGLTPSSIKIYNKGVQVDTTDETLGTFTGITSSTKGYEIASQVNGTNSNSGISIGEFIFYTRALSDFEKQQIEQYLSKKWGIKIS